MGDMIIITLIKNCRFARVYEVSLGKLMIIFNLVKFLENVYKSLKLIVFF